MQLLLKRCISKTRKPKMAILNVKSNAINFNFVIKFNWKYYFIVDFSKSKITKCLLCWSGWGVDLDGDAGHFIYAELSIF